MTYEEYVEENTRKLEELKKLPYEELRRMEKEIIESPDSTRADIVNICFACGIKSIELGLLSYTIEEVRRKLGIDNYKVQTKCRR